MSTVRTFILLAAGYQRVVRILFRLGWKLLVGVPPAEESPHLGLGQHGLLLRCPVVDTSGSYVIHGALPIRVSSASADESVPSSPPPERKKSSKRRKEDDDDGVRECSWPSSL